MTLAELLKEQGIDNEAVDKIVSAMKENKIFTATEENLDVRYGKLKNDHETATKKLEEANGLIEQFKKSAKGNEDLQGKISGYESKVGELEAALAETKLKAAIKVALLSEKAIDVDYLTYKLETKLKDENKALELDGSGNVKDWTNIVSGLKTQFPTQFEGSTSKKIEEHKLEMTDENRTLTKSDILKKPYAERMKLYSENKEAYEAAMHS